MQGQLLDSGRDQCYILCIWVDLKPVMSQQSEALIEIQQTLLPWDHSEQLIICGLCGGLGLFNVLLPVGNFINVILGECHTKQANPSLVMQGPSPFHFVC